MKHNVILKMTIVKSRFNPEYDNTDILSSLNMKIVKTYHHPAHNNCQTHIHPENENCQNIPILKMTINVKHTVIQNIHSDRIVGCPLVDPDNVRKPNREPLRVFLDEVVMDWNHDVIGQLWGVAGDERKELAGGGIILGVAGFSGAIRSGNT